MKKFSCLILTCILSTLFLSCFTNASASNYNHRNTSVRHILKDINGFFMYIK